MLKSKIPEVVRLTKTAFAVILQNLLYWREQIDSHACLMHIYLSRDSESRLAGRSGNRIPVVARYSATILIIPVTHLYNGYRRFPRGKAAETWH